MDYYRTLKALMRGMFPKLSSFCEKRKIIIKFLVSGCIAASVDLSSLYFFTDVLGIWYLVSSAMAFMLAFIVSFSLHKFWTFRDNNLKEIKWQLSSFLFVALFNLFLNSNGIYFLVEKFNLHYLIAQVIIAAILGLGSFLIYRFVIFEKKKYPDEFGADEMISKKEFNEN